MISGREGLRVWMKLHVFLSAGGRERVEAIGGAS
jgi:hypothetical protein